MLAPLFTQKWRLAKSTCLCVIRESYNYSSHARPISIIFLHFTRKSYSKYLKTNFKFVCFQSCFRFYRFCPVGLNFEMASIWVHCLIAVISISSLDVDCRKHHGKVVTTLINARWEVTPVVLEIAEFIADENPYEFWVFVDDVTKLDPPLVELASEREQYVKSLELASRVLSPVKMNMLRLSLSLHVYSPKVEMYGQMASEKGIKCPAAVDYDGRIFCQVKELREALAR